MIKDHFYLTTTLPYVNADPHIGHTLEFLQADAYARFFRSKLGEDNVFFNVGMDEHGLKILTKARESNQTPQEYADHFAARWEEFCELFLVSYDSFYRTSAQSHHKSAQAFWAASSAAGDIYKKKYAGWYCVGCEEFKTEKELVDGKCPLHNQVPSWIEEENYFFKLSKYRDLLLEHYEKYPDTVRPASKLNELRNWISQMEDISISRVKENLPWGIEVPEDPAHVMYVWFDALTNYAASVGYPDDMERFDKYWPVVQLYGPDNLRFQGAYWQGMLASVGLPFSQKLLCHGMILAADGTKMSKTIGNVVSPFEQASKFGVEAIRYYMLAQLPTYGDASYRETDLIHAYNSNLADNWGNLLSRVVHLANKRGLELKVLQDLDSNLIQQVDDLVDNYTKAFQDFDIHTAAHFANELAILGNKYIDDHKPWLEEHEGSADLTLYSLAYLLAKIADLYAPIVPESSQKAKQSLNQQEKVILFPKLEVDAA